MGVVTMALAACGQNATDPRTTAATAANSTVFVSGTLPASAVMSYSAADLGIAIDHPADWRVEEQLEDGIVAFYSQAVPGDSFIENYNVAVVQLPEGVDLAAFAELDASRLTVSIEGYAVVGGGETTVDGVPAVTVVFDGVTSDVPLRFFRLITVRDNKGYEFTFAASRDEFDNFLPVVDQMLAGLRFTS